MRRVTGNKNVALAECVNERRDKWRIRLCVENSEEKDSVEYLEEEFSHKPTPEDLANMMFESDTDITDTEMEAIGKALGYEQGELSSLVKAEREKQLKADPYKQLMEITREQHLDNPNVSDEQALRIPSTFFSFAELCKRKKQVESGIVFKYNGKLWRVVQPHIPQDTYVPSMDTAALYTRIEPTHKGTLEDPIPYEQGMAFEEGKYYEQFGELYLCILTTTSGYPSDLQDLPTIVKKV